MPIFSKLTWYNNNEFITVIILGNKPIICTRWRMRMDAIYKTVGNNIRKRRKELGLSQVGLEKRMNFTAKYISSVENGKRRIPLDVFLLFCKILDTSPSFLLCETEPEHLEEELDIEHLKELITMCPPDSYPLLYDLVASLLRSFSMYADITNKDKPPCVNNCTYFNDIKTDSKV